jgi:hypothetical protein
VSATASRSRVVRETLKCRADPAYFLDSYVRAYDAPSRDWIPLKLWPAQFGLVDQLHDSPLLVLLKARQLGCTSVVLGYALWLALFRPAATVLLFSRRDDEATDLLAFRMRGMYDRLPEWCQCRPNPDLPDNDHEWQLPNGSRVLAFGRVGGDSYTASMAVVDEADLIPELERLLQSVKPTVDAGGKLVLLSRPDKSRPESAFKATYRAAKEGGTAWVPYFLPWSANPSRDAAWYEGQKADSLKRTGSLDALHEQYPATDAEALAPASLDKRLPGEWLMQCYVPQEPLQQLPKGAPSLAGLAVFVAPVAGAVYVVGADPAEGNPTSHESALKVLDVRTGEEVASLAGRLEPRVFAEAIHKLGIWYNDSAVMVLRNNHGHAVLLWLWEHSHLARLCGHDGKEGWLESAKGKVLLYEATADAFRHGDTILHDFTTFNQLASIEGATLKGPGGVGDDRADAYATAVATTSIARGWQPREGE